MSTVVSDGSFKVELDFLITAASVVNLRLLNAVFVLLLLSQGEATKDVFLVVTF